MLSRESKLSRGVGGLVCDERLIWRKQIDMWADNARTQQVIIRTLHIDILLGRRPVIIKPQYV